MKKRSLTVFYLLSLLIWMIIYSILIILNDFDLITILDLLFIIYVLITLPIVIKKRRKKTYFEKKDKCKEFKKRKKIIKSIKGYICDTFKIVYLKLPEKQNIDIFINALKSYLKKIKDSNTEKFQLIFDNFIKILREIHPFEYYITETQRELMRTTFKTFMDKLIPDNIENLYKIYKKNKGLPKMDEIFAIGLLNLSLVNLDLIYEKLKLGNVEELVDSIMSLKKLPMIGKFLLKSKEDDIKKYYEELFSSDELKKRESHYLKDTFMNFQEIFSKYELIKKYLGYLLEIESVNFSIQAFNAMRFEERNELMLNLEEKFINESDWKLFFELGKSRTKAVRNLKAHEELKIVDNIITGWFESPDPPLTIQEFNKLKTLFTIFLWKIYDLFEIEISDKFIDEFIQF